MPDPKASDSERTFLGITEWYRMWIYNYEMFVKPLYALIMDKIRELQWTKEATRAFDQLKKALMSAPALGLPDDGFNEAYHPPMRPIRISPDCCDKCLIKCPQFRLKIEGCAIRGYDINFNITHVCTEFHKDQTKMIPPVPRKAVIPQVPSIREVEEQITPVITKIGPYAIKKTGVQKLIINPKWSLKRVEMGVQ
ncbi:hypothetical protein HGM15179_004432, partial [Zosterops borbonicus]